MLRVGIDPANVDLDRADVHQIAGDRQGTGRAGAAGPEDAVVGQGGGAEIDRAFSLDHPRVGKRLPARVQRRTGGDIEGAVVGQQGSGNDQIAGVDIDRPRGRVVQGDADEAGGVGAALGVSAVVSEGVAIGVGIFVWFNDKLGDH